MDKELSIRKQKLRINLFDECFRDMQRNIKLVLKKTSHVSYKVENTKQLFDFVSQIEEHMDLFKQKNLELLEKVNLLDQFFKSKPTLSQQNKEVVWKYLDNLYTIASGKKIQVEEPKFNVEKISGLLENIMTDKNNGLENLIGDISSKLQDSLKDKNFDQNKIIQDFLAGKTDSSGINFAEIITQASKSLEEKVESGEIDKKKLKDIASNFKL